MDSTSETLVTLLAQTDALYEPVRTWSNRAQVAGVIEARQRFEDGGLPLDSPGGDAAARKAQERLLNDLENTGDVKFRRRRGKRIAWKLADTADWRLRRLSCFSDFPEMFTAMLSIAAHESSPRLERPCNAVWEGWLVGALQDETIQERPVYKDRVLRLEEILAPALCRGWIEACSDLGGIVAYSLTPEGKMFLLDPKLPAGVKETDYSSEANDRYWAELIAARKKLSTIRGSENHCVIPLGSGSWPDDSEAAGIPSIFTTAGTVRTPANMRKAIAKAGPAAKLEAAR
jgi:hypothetical protein